MMNNEANDKINNGINNDIEFFIAYMKDVKNASENTLQSYKRDLKAMAMYFSEQDIEDVGRINGTSINSYILYMERIGKSAATISRNISSIKTFFRCMINNGRINREPTENLRTPQNEKKPTKTITSDEIEKIKSKIQGNNSKELRDRAMIGLMLDTGLKVSEITELKIADINMQYAYVTCHGRKKDKTVRFSDETLNVIKEYINYGRNEFLKCCKNEDDDINGTLFLNCFGRKMSRQGFWKMFKEYATLAEVENITTHAIHK